MSRWKFAGAAIIGGVCGALLPLERSLATRRPPQSDAAPVVAPCPEVGAPDATALVASAEREIAAFRRTWGTPVMPPSGWDPVADEARLRAALDAFPNDLAAVSCEFYPCVLVLASTVAMSSAEVEAAFDVPAPAVGLASSRGARTLHTVSVAAVDARPLDDAQWWWVRRLRARLTSELGPDLDRLLAIPPPEPEP